MHIGLVIWSLCRSKGGIERFGVLLGNEMKKRGHCVTIFCYSYNKKYSTPLYMIDQGIQIEYIDNYNDKNFFVEKKQLLKNLNIDVVCALFSWELLLIFPQLLHKTGIPFIISEHNNPDIIVKERWNHYERLGCLTSADRIHLLTDEYKQKLPTYLQLRAVVIPNPAPQNQANTFVHKDKYRILAMGRFKDSHKNFSILIKAFASLAQAFPDWELVIAGDGESRETYEKLIDKYRLKNRVSLPGILDEINSFYSSGDIFCIPSRYEGFPMVALEAQAHGLPLVGFASCSGVNEIIQHGINGFLAEDETPEGIGTWLSLLMQDFILREEMRKKSVLLNNRYDKMKIFDQWEKLFIETLNEKMDTALDKALSTKQEEMFCKFALTEILERQNPFNRQYTLQMKTISTKLANIENKINSQHVPDKKLLQGKSDFSLFQRILLALYSPFVYLFTNDKKFYYDYKHKTRGYLNYTKHPANLILKRILNMIGPKI